MINGLIMLPSATHRLVSVTLKTVPEHDLLKYSGKVLKLYVINQEVLEETTT